MNYNKYKDKINEFNKRINSQHRKKVFIRNNKFYKIITIKLKFYISI